MIPLRLAEVADVCDGKLVEADPDAVVSSVVTDSRDATGGALFVALGGARSDGHDFIRAAHAAGAVAALASRGDGPLVRVADPLRALASLAEAVRARSEAKVIAITGSSGKTCTKDFTASACATHLRTVAATASFNNEIGVPLTVLSVREDTEALILEIGSRGIGHISSLAGVARPTISVVTNVGPAHAGMFGSIENTAAAKGELVEMLGSDGVAVLNADDARVRAMAERTKAHVVFFGTSPDAAVRADGIGLDDVARASFDLVTPEGRAAVSLRMAGEHMVSNALAAAAAARAAGVPLRAIAAGLSMTDGSAWRMQIHDAGGVRIVNDAYNANPDSVAAALRALASMAGGRPTWAVLGHMAELGDQETEQHDRIGRLAVRLGVTHLVTVGSPAKAIHEAAKLEGMFGGEAFFAATASDALAYIRERLEPDAIVLVKASRAAGLEAIAIELAEAIG